MLVLDLTDVSSTCRLGSRESELCDAFGLNQSEELLLRVETFGGS